ncbi:MAG: hypothetical protein KKD69_01435 [Euryarchaeota archaeon]|nr:hypothetical protein [Euryarchaeota archaeon]
MHFIKQHPDGREEVLSEIINPGIPIPPGASQIHGIYDQDVQDKPQFRGRAQELLTWLNGCDLAGYNSDKFDIVFYHVKIPIKIIGRYPEKSSRIPH